MAVEGMNGTWGGVGSSPRIYEQLRGSRVGTVAQISTLFPASPLANVIAGSSEDGFEGLRLGLRRTKVTGRPAFWRASMNEVNASPVSRLP